MTKHDDAGDAAEPGAVSDDVKAVALFGDDVEQPENNVASRRGRVAITDLYSDRDTYYPEGRPSMCVRYDDHDSDHPT